MAHRLRTAYTHFTCWVLRGRRGVAHIPTNSSKDPSSLWADEERKHGFAHWGTGWWVITGEDSPHTPSPHTWCCQPTVYLIPSGEGQSRMGYSMAGSQLWSRHNLFLLHSLKNKSWKGVSWRYSGQNRPFTLFCIPGESRVAGTQADGLREPDSQHRRTIPYRGKKGRQFPKYSSRPIFSPAKDFSVILLI